MQIARTSVLLIITALVIHVTWWRIRRPQFATATLRNIFVAVAVGWAVSVLAPAGAWRISPLLMPKTPWSFIYTLVFYFAMSLVYMITYIGIEAESPSILILFAARRAGQNGVSRDELSGIVRDEEMIDERLRSLTKAGVLLKSSAGYSITRYGRLYLSFYMVPRVLMGLGATGG